MPMLVSSKTGVLLTVFRVAGIDHWMVTHGTSVVPPLTVQPAIVMTSVASKARLPPTFTSVLLVVTVAWPPCGHWIVHPKSRMPAPMTYMTSRAPLFTDTPDAESLMLLPLASLISIPLESIVMLLPLLSVSSSVPPSSSSTSLWPLLVLSTFLAGVADSGMAPLVYQVPVHTG